MYNYPDVYTFLTNLPHQNFSVVQAALAIRPAMIRAGQPFEVIVLLQNTSDSSVDVTLTLSMPDKDIKGQKGRFIISKQRLVVGMEPAEVGYASLQLSSLPDTAPDDNYTVGVEMNVKPASKKPLRIRQATGGGAFNPKALPPKLQKEVSGLQKLQFSTKTRGLLRSNILETSFGILPGTVGKPLNLKTDWVSLWTMANHDDPSLLLVKYAELMRLKVLPLLNRQRFHDPLLERVKTRFEKAGYPLQALEAIAITKMLVLILEYADVKRTGQSITEAGMYNVAPRFAANREDNDQPIPRWLRLYLREVSRDERAAKFPVKAISQFAFDGLLYDASIHAFDLIKKATGEDLGMDEEIALYADTLLKKLRKTGEITFSLAYMPLVLAGIVIYDRVMTTDEKLNEILDDVKFLMQTREDEHTDENSQIFSMADRIITQALRKYGTLDSKNL